VFYFTIGVFLGIICAVPVFSAVTWCVQITVGRGFGAGLIALSGIALAQWFWAACACMAGFAAFFFYPRYDFLMRLGASTILAVLAYGLIRAESLSSLTWNDSKLSPRALFQRSFVRSFGMALRFPAFLAVFLAVSLQARLHPWPMVLPLSGGMATGFALWLLFFVILASLFGKKVPEAICLRSLNKLRKLGIVVCLILASISMGTLFIWKGP
jgi:threonine/homoserine/homoserine lactone efflux protein